jgi:hypothetical protein
VECEYRKDSTSVHYRWVAEPCEVKQ